MSTDVATRSAAFASFRDLWDAGIITETGIELPDDLTFERWESIGHWLARLRDGTKFWTGDWLLFGEGHYSERVAQAMDALGMDYAALRRVQTVCMRVPPKRRRATLSWSHHAEVAPLEPREQKKMLDLAEKKGLTRDELRREIRGEDDAPRPNLREAAGLVWSAAQKNGSAYSVPLGPMQDLRDALGASA